MDDSRWGPLDGFRADGQRDQDMSRRLELSAPTPPTYREKKGTKEWVTSPSRLRSGTSINTAERQGPGSFPAGTHRGAGRVILPEKAWKLSIPPTYLAPSISSMWLLLSCTLYNKPVRVFCWALRVPLVNYHTWGGYCRKPRFIARQ